MKPETYASTCTFFGDRGAHHPPPSPLPAPPQRHRGRRRDKQRSHRIPRIETGTRKGPQDHSAFRHLGIFHALGLGDKQGLFLEKRLFFDNGSVPWHVARGLRQRPHCQAHVQAARGGRAGPVTSHGLRFSQGSLSEPRSEQTVCPGPGPLSLATQLPAKSEGSFY